MAITWLLQTSHAKTIICKERYHHTTRANGPQLWRCWLSLTSWESKEYVWHSGNKLGCVVVFSWSVLMINGQIYQPSYEIGMIARNSAPSRMKVWVAPPGESPRATEVHWVGRICGRGNKGWHISYSLEINISIKSCGLSYYPYSYNFPGKNSNQNPGEAIYIWGEFTIRSKWIWVLQCLCMPSF